MEGTQGASHMAGKHDDHGACAKTYDVTSVWDVSQTQDFTSQDFSIAEVRRQLDEHGVAVIGGLMSDVTCDEAQTELHAWLATFGLHGWPDNIGSIIHKYNISHHPVAWDARLRAKPVFSTLWNTDKLLTSLDGISVGQPPELGDTTFRPPQDKGANGLHLDQGPARKGLHAYQGALYMEEACHDDWCFLVIENSHKYHEEFFQQHRKNSRSEFRRLTASEQEWYLERGCQIKRVPVPKRGLLLWDSRTVHAGAPPLPERKNANRWRYVVFVCMAPAIWASPGDMKEKRIAYRELRITRHWPAQGTSLFKNYRPTPFDVKEIPEIAKSREARLLAGDLEYDFADGASNGPKYIPITN